MVQIKKKPFSVSLIKISGNSKYPVYQFNLNSLRLVQFSKFHCICINRVYHYQFPNIFHYLDLQRRLLSVLGFLIAYERHDIISNDQKISTIISLSAYDNFVDQIRKQPLFHRLTQKIITENAYNMASIPRSNITWQSGAILDLTKGGKYLLKKKEIARALIYKFYPSPTRIPIFFK